MPMTPDAKSALRKTVRGTKGGSGGLRERLLTDLHAATETAYRLQVRSRDAGLLEAAERRRARFEGWIGEQVRAQGAGKKARTADDFRRDAEKQAAYTWLNRLIILRLMEAAELRSPAVVTGGWESRGYQDFRSLAPALVRGDETEGYAFLLRLVFEDLATELPGLYGSAGVADLVPMPAATLRHVVEALDDVDLETCWTDDMTLGWVYQFWNDPEREALDDKLNSGGKVENHEIAGKTQMFTERYMVDWLLQNSLLPMWLSMCKSHGWTPEVGADGTLERLEERRIDWRAKREAKEVSLTELMPLRTDAERRWAYYVPQPIPDDAVEHAPETVRDLKILDPAVGSGHFLVVAFDLLVSLYREEAGHRGETGEAKWSDRAIVERILETNLAGIDLDPRAVQIAAAALWLKAKTVSSEARPRQLNLVAANLRLTGLPDDDPALLELRREVERETGIPAALTDTIINALQGADHLGSLLKVDATVDEAIKAAVGKLGRAVPRQGDMFMGFPEKLERLTVSADAAKETLLERMEGFLAKHTAGDDLGLRLRGEQLAAGVRFVRLVKEEQHDLVVANPPYQGTSKMADARYIEKQYPLGKADLYAAFLLRGLELTRRGGTSAMLTMRNWMFVRQFAGLRARLLEKIDLRVLHDLSSGAFEEISAAQVIVSVVTSVFRNADADGHSVAIKAFDDATVLQVGETQRKRAATLCHEVRYGFDPVALRVVPEWPVVYSWGAAKLKEYGDAQKLGEIAYAREGLGTKDDTRFLRWVWEVWTHRIHLHRYPDTSRPEIANPWVPFIKGAAGREWIEPLDHIVDWHLWGGRIALFSRSRYGRGAREYFRQGIAIKTVGQGFSARAHRYSSIFGHAGTSVFWRSGRPAQLLCELNNSLARETVSSMNPTISCQITDAVRLPLFHVNSADFIFDTLQHAFTTHESHREPSVEFKSPGPSPWRHAQEWAQTAVDRPEGEPLPPYVEELDPEPSSDHVSFALGVALGRFGADGEGILDPDSDDLSAALPAGICFLDGTLDRSDLSDSLGHPAAALLHAAWGRLGPDIDSGRVLRTWLRLKLFGDVHKGMYESRPIHWPLSSAKKTFVAYVNIHRMTVDTLHVLQADHLQPALTRLEGQLTDLRAARDGPDQKAARAAEKRFDTVQKNRDELVAFNELVAKCADEGPPPTDPAPKKCPLREVDARYAPDLDDGVMINSAALWPLLDPQWKDPKKWWTELSLAKGRKDYDWSHLAMRYWPTRVDKKCQKDPSLGVAHGCFWKYHPERAWAWELRLQDEIGPDFRIEEPPYRNDSGGNNNDNDGGDAPHRKAWLKNHPDQALTAVQKESLRRRGKGKDAPPITEMTLLDPGLWSALPAECWALETRIIEKQKSPFRLNAPDEPEARAAYKAQNPTLAQKRAELLTRTAGLFKPGPKGSTR